MPVLTQSHLVSALLVYTILPPRWPTSRFKARHAMLLHTPGHFVHIPNTSQNQVTSCACLLYLAFPWNLPAIFFSNLWKIPGFLNGLGQTILEYFKSPRIESIYSLSHTTLCLKLLLPPPPWSRSLLALLSRLFKWSSCLSISSRWDYRLEISYFLLVLYELQVPLCTDCFPPPYLGQLTFTIDCDYLPSFPS